MSGVFSINGISNSAYNTYDFLSANYTSLIGQEALDGANYVAIGSISQISLTTGAVTDVANNGTASFSSIGPAIAAAEALGLKVMLKPQIGALDPNLPNGFGNMTDTNLVIANPAAFFAGYEAYIVQWAKLAQQYNVPILSIGNEMLAATKPQYTTYWNHLIDAVHQVYSGQLTYSAMLPGLTTYAPDNEAAQIQFWNKLDFAGLDVYPTLTSLTDPTVGQLDAAWTSQTVLGQTQNYVQFITQLAASIGKPVLFTETGVSSFPGAADRFDYADAIAGRSTTPSDQALQANWWQSFFDTWGANPPSWLAGVFAWNNNPGEAPGTTLYNNGYSVSGKAAELVLSSWFGGKDYLSVAQSSITGSTSSDRIILSGGAGAATSRLASYNTVVSVALHGTIIGGKSATVHFYINGADYGAVTLSTSTAGGFVDGKGVSWSADQTFTFTVNGAVNVSQLKVAMDSAANVGGAENSQVVISSASISGVALSQDTYNPATGAAHTGAFNLAGLVNGGFALIDATPWNAALAANTIGTASNPIIVNGGGGNDTVYVLGQLQQYTISGSGGVITLHESSGLNQNAILTNIAQVAFADTTLDLRGVNTVTGGSGDDVLRGTSGNDLINGVGGTNTAVFSGAASQYTVTTNAGGVTTVTDTVAGRDGVDTLTNIQQLQFSNTTLVLDLHSAQDLTVYKLYQAAFARTPDNAGYRYWATQADAQNLSALKLADAFLASPEFTQKYGASPTDLAYATAMYTNVLQRTPDAAGLAYWVSNLTKGEARDQLLVDFAISQENATLIDSHTANGYWTT